jgi:hypothetical protein
MDIRELWIDGYEGGLPTISSTWFGVPHSGRERQAVHRLGHLMACKGWSKGRLPYQGSGLSTLRRLFPLPTSRSVEFSLEPGPQWQTSAPTAGRRCVLKSQKPVSLTYQLHVRLGNRMVLRATGLSRDFFGRNPTPKWGSDAQRTT